MSKHEQLAKIFRTMQDADFHDAFQKHLELGKQVAEMRRTNQIAAFHGAVQNNPDQIESTLPEGYDINSPELAVFTYAGSKKSIETLLRLGSRPDLANSNCFISPINFYTNSLSGKEPIISWLFKHSQWIDEGKEAIKLLLKNGADVNKPVTQHHLPIPTRHPLIYLAKNSRYLNYSDINDFLGFITFLVAHGCNPKLPAYPDLDINSVQDPHLQSIPMQIIKIVGAHYADSIFAAIKEGREEYLTNISKLLLLACKKEDSATCHLAKLPKELVQYIWRIVISGN